MKCYANKALKDIKIVSSPRWSQLHTELIIQPQGVCGITCSTTYHLICLQIPLTKKSCGSKLYDNQPGGAILD